MFGYVIIFTVTALLQLVAAQQQTSLILPGFEPQPFSVDVLGVDSQSSRTTWAVHNGPTDATFLPADAFPGIATLIEGSNYVSVNYIYTDTADPNASPAPNTFRLECTITASPVGDCSGSVFGTQVARTQTTFTPFPVLVGTPAPTPQSVTLTPAPSATAVSTTSTTTTSSTATSSKKKSSATAISRGVGFTSIVGVNVYLVMSVIGNILC